MHERSHHHSNIRAVMSYILSFILCFLLMGISACVIIQSTLLNEKFLSNQVIKSNYSDYALTAVQSESESYGLASGFDKDFCKSLIKRDNISADVSQLISSIYHEGTSEPDYAALQKNISNKFVDNARSRNIAVNGQSEAAITLLSKNIVQSYKNHISFPATIVSAMRAIIPKAAKFILIAEIISFVFIAAIIVLLFKINRSRRNFFRYCIYAFSGASILFITAGSVALGSGQIGRIGIVEQSLYELTVS